MGPIKDSSGAICGLNGTNVENRKFLYRENPDDYISSLFFQSHASSLNSICVEKCPDYSFNAVEVTVGETPDYETDELLCHNTSRFNDVRESQSFETAMKAGDCMKFIVPTIPFNGRCLPDLTKVENSLSNHIYQSNFNLDSRCY